MPEWSMTSIAQTARIETMNAASSTSAAAVSASASVTSPSTRDPSAIAVSTLPARSYSSPVLMMTNAADPSSSPTADRPRGSSTNGISPLTRYPTYGMAIKRTRTVAARSRSVSFLIESTSSPRSSLPSPLGGNQGRTSQIGQRLLSRVVVEDDLLRRRVGLAGEGVAALHLVGLERPVGVHLDRALDDLRAAGPADAALAGEGGVGPDRERRLEDRGAVGRQHERRAAPVEGDRHLRAGRVARRLRGSTTGRRRALDVEHLGVDRPLRHPLGDQLLAQRRDHLVGPAQEPLVDVGRRDQRVEEALHPRHVEAP